MRKAWGHTFIKTASKDKFHVKESFKIIIMKKEKVKGVDQYSTKVISISADSLHHAFV